MLCGRWESYPREFAKCRRCRKAKYCGKECQSTAWSEGHRFWCSAKDGDDEATEQPDAAAPSAGPSSTRQPHPLTADILPGFGPGAAVPPGGARAARAERERERDRERVRERVVATTAAGVDSTQMARMMAHAFRNPDNNRAWTAVLRDAENTEQATRRTAAAVPSPVTWNARPVGSEQGWGRAVYEPSPFGAGGAGPSGQQGAVAAPPQTQVQARERRHGVEDALDSLVVGHGRRRAETMPGGMVPVVDSTTQNPTQADRSRFFDQQQAETGNTTTATQPENARRGLEVEVTIAGPSNSRVMGIRGDGDVGMDDEVYRMGRDDFPMDVD